MSPFEKIADLSIVPEQDGEMSISVIGFSVESLEFAWSLV
jgi:hypothetical protein